jgi:hypothetical protein
MKRQRSLGELETERDRAWATYCALRDECEAHPVRVAERAARAVRDGRARLPTKVPAPWLDLWVREAGLYDVTLDCSVVDGEGGYGEQWLWTCALYTTDTGGLADAAFGVLQPTTFVVYSPDGRSGWHDANFAYVAAPPAPEMASAEGRACLWDAAVAANDGAWLPAMAAVCFACAEQLGDYEALPAAAAAAAAADGGSPSVIDQSV